MTRGKPLTFAGHALKRDTSVGSTWTWKRQRPSPLEVTVTQYNEGWTAYVKVGDGGEWSRSSWPCRGTAQEALDAIEAKMVAIFQSYADLLGYEVDHG